MRLSKEEFGQRAAIHVAKVSEILEGAVVTIIARKSGVEHPYIITTEKDLDDVKAVIDTLHAKRNRLRAESEEQCGSEQSSEQVSETKEKDGQ